MGLNIYHSHECGIQLTSSFNPLSNNITREGDIRMLITMKSITHEMSACVLATVSSQKPYCSIMSYVTDDACHNIYMASSRNTKKYRNLKENPAVSILIDNREAGAMNKDVPIKALTVEGVFHEILDRDEKEIISLKLRERHPGLKEFMDDPDTEVFCIRIISFMLLNGLKDAYYERVT
jgi:nitroimidazol reductase NimA-like FMN-containing flavoprotein (pyridoxamine 5'-phosphate oxidase superfamily)